MLAFVIVTKFNPVLTRKVFAHNQSRCSFSDASFGMRHRYNDWLSPVEPTH